MYKCEVCDATFESAKVKANHIRWNHKKQTYTAIGLKKVSEVTSKRLSKQFGDYKEEIVICHCCPKKVTAKYRTGKKKEKYFCSRSCANKRIHSIETKQKISSTTSDAMKKLWSNPEFVKKHLKNVGKRRFSSKGEEEVKAFFKSHFEDDQWTHGGSLVINDEILVRDLYSNKLKVCIEYDGIWHFKDINGQLAEKQYKDSLLELWCKQNGYRLIRLSEDYYLRNKDKAIQDVVNEVYISTVNKDVVKFYL